MPPRLPIDDVLPDLIAAVARGGAAVLHAPPGAGKTTRVPPALAAARPGGQIVVLEPRRVAARAAARRIAAEQEWTLGREVGWWIRFERRFRSDSRVVFATEGVLLRWLERDPFLDGVGCLVFDEFHERSLAADLSLALARRVRRDVRPDLALVVMSATLDVDAISSFLDGAPVVASAGKLHPVETRLAERADDRPLETRVAAAVGRALAASDGDVLVFLPGLAEIRRAEGALASAAHGAGFDLLPLHGDLPIESQDAALRRGARRRIVLATNVAETSVTVEGVRAVVDAGLARVASYDPSSGLDRLDTVRISRAAADQRAGRAGREAPGLCLRLWTAAEDAALRPFELPEVKRVDLSGAVLELALWGDRDPAAFEWFEAPEPARLARATRELRDLGAIGDHGVTSLGRRLAALPLPPRLARLVLEGERRGVEDGAALLAALLAERDPLRGEARREGRAGTRSDLLERLDWLDRRSHRRVFDAAGQILARLATAPGTGAEADRAHRQDASVKGEGTFPDVPSTSVGAKELWRSEAEDETRAKTSSEGKTRPRQSEAADQRGAFGAGSRSSAIEADGASAPRRPSPSLPVNRKPSSSLSSSASPSWVDSAALPPQRRGAGAEDPDEPLLRAIAAAYLDRLCRRREPGSDRAVMAGGRGVRQARTSAVRDAELFVAVEIDAGRAGERSEALVRVASAVEREWLPPELVRSEDELAWDDARMRVVARRTVRFEDLILDEREIPLPPGAEAAGRIARLLAERAAIDPSRALALDRPEVASLLARVAFLARARPDAGWVAPDAAFLRALVVELAAGRRSFEDLARSDVVAAILDSLPWERRRALDVEAPERIEVPSGSRIRVDYSDPAQPVLAVKIQELFGLAETPRLAGGRVPVVLHLLAPSGRPQQVTADLASFWRNGYPVVRRELAGRYPKHPWPDDPLSASATRRTKPR